MFFEFKTKKNEPVAINIGKILFITPYKNGTMLVDSEGNEYEMLESYESAISRLCEVVQQKLRQNV